MFLQSLVLLCGVVVTVLGLIIMLSGVQHLAPSMHGNVADIADTMVAGMVILMLGVGTLCLSIMVKGDRG